mmetsp:Transcript_6468/g.16093  ORF Transcript_6468/g.16093 Transcript_6468/m.16093 type:complete len:399 (-) Transcript_6468:547-1743(-)
MEEATALLIAPVATDEELIPRLPRCLCGGCALISASLILLLVAATAAVAGGGAGGGSEGGKWSSSHVVNAPEGQSPGLVSNRPKVAFLFLTAGTIPQHPIWSKFFEGGDERLFSIYVNANPGAHQEGIFVGKEVPHPVTTAWGNISFVRATVHLLKTALADEDNQRFALMSDNSIPLRSFHAVYCLLMADPHSVIHACIRPEEKQRTLSAEISAGFPHWINGSVWRKSETWWMLNRRHAVIVTKDDEIILQFEANCFGGTGSGCFSEEHYFPTLLAIHGEETMTTCSGTVNYIDWSPPYLDGVHSAHPKTFSSEQEVLQADFFAAKREMCGGRNNTPSGWGSAALLDGVTCGASGATKDLDLGARKLPTFKECLFMRKIADELAPMIGRQSIRILESL